MDRNVRPASFKTMLITRQWLRGLVLASAFAGAGLATGLLAPAPASAQAEANRQMSVPIAVTGGKPFL